MSFESHMKFTSKHGKTRSVVEFHMNFADGNGSHGKLCEFCSTMVAESQYQWKLMDTST